MTQVQWLLGQTGLLHIYMRMGGARLSVIGIFFAVLFASILPTACVHEFPNCY